MSYLICLYVYYHGNNLISFGIIKGLKDEEIVNSGMKRAEEIDPSLVDRSLIEEVKERENIENQVSYDDMMRIAIKNSQKQSYDLYQSGMSKSDVFNNTPDAIIEGYNDGGDIDLNFFNTLNGF